MFNNDIFYKHAKTLNFNDIMANWNVKNEIQYGSQVEWTHVSSHLNLVELVTQLLSGRHTMTVDKHALYSWPKYY